MIGYPYKDAAGAKTPVAKKVEAPKAEVKEEKKPEPKQSKTSTKKK